MSIRSALRFSTRGGAPEGTLRTPFPMEVAPRTTGGCPVRNFFAWIENSGWRKVLAMPMVTIRMLGWSGAKVACQKSACDTMSLKCQGTWRTGGRHVFSHSNTKEPPPATAAQFPSRALMCSRRMNENTLNFDPPPGCHVPKTALSKIAWLRPLAYARLPRVRCFLPPRTSAVGSSFQWHARAASG